MGVFLLALVSAMTNFYSVLPSMLTTTRGLAACIARLAFAVQTFNGSCLDVAFSVDLATDIAHSRSKRHLRRPP